MYCASSREFFEISIGPQPKCALKARLFCIKDFLKRCLIFPLALIRKAVKTFFRLAAVALSALFLFATLGSSSKTRALFVDRIVLFARDLADWVLLPFAFALCFFRLILALLIHPNFYFNGL